MNQLWVRISLTYIGIVIFLFLIPTIILFAYQADTINQGDFDGEIPLESLRPGINPQTFMGRLISLSRIELAISLVRILLSVSLVGILVGVISSRGLSAPMQNLAKAAQAVGSQDLSQRIDVKGSDEVREVAIAFNAMTAALEEADALRNNMLADIAHELRTPLTVIQGNLRAILDDVYELDKVEVARLYDQTRQLSRLVDDLHDLALLESKQFSLNLAEHNMKDLIHNVAAIYQPIFEDSGVSLQLDLPKKIPLIQADQARLTQCLNNLLNNALRHTPKGGEVRILLQADEGQIRVSVEDNGAGIEVDHLPYVFDRFYRIDPDRNRKTGGSGLGLAITQALVFAHGGEIQAVSEGKHQGSTFTIMLPCCSQSSNFQLN